MSVIDDRNVQWRKEHKFAPAPSGGGDVDLSNYYTKLETEEIAQATEENANAYTDAEIAKLKAWCKAEIKDAITECESYTDEKVILLKEWVENKYVSADFLAYEREVINVLGSGTRDDMKAYTREQIDIQEESGNV